MSTDLVTTTAVVAAQAAKASTIISLNLTVWFSIITVCIAIVTIVVKLTSEKRSIREETLRESQVIKDINQNIKTNSAQIGVANNSIQLLRDADIEIRNSITETRHQGDITRLNQENTNRTVEELKGNNKEILKKLEDLVKQLYDFLSQN